MRKLKCLAAALALCLLCSVFPLTVEAAVLSGKCGDDAYWYYNNGTLTISGTGVIYPYYGNEVSPWNGLREKIFTLVIEDGITEIGMMDFGFLDRLIDVSLPDSLTYIDCFAFYACEALETVNFPKGLTGIGQEAFNGCSSLKTVEIPASVTFVDAGVFTCCSSLTDVLFRSNPDIPGFMSGNSIFRGCTALEEIRVEEGHLALRSIDGALYVQFGDGSLLLNSYPSGRKNPEWRVADNTVIIDQFSVVNNPYLETVYIPDSLESIGTMAFSGCSSLKKMIFEGNAPTLGVSVFFNCVFALSYPCDNTSWDEAQNSWDNPHILGGSGFIDWEESHIAPTVVGVILPTCTTAGCTTYTCVCGDTYTADETEALGHDWTVVEHIPSTCTGGGHVVFECQDCGERMNGEEETPLGHDYVNGTCTRCGEADPDYIPQNPFTDVPEVEWYFQPVLWAVEKGITSGTSTTTFSPEDTCTRAQVVTFLWRAVGKPAPESAENSFTDVKPGDYYYDAVLWAVEQGITSGTGNGQFSPDDSCTRAQVVTFLWRAMGKEMPESDENPFGDVPAGEYFYNPVLWAVENKITSGTGVGKFSPEDSCTRAQVVTFLYRAMAEN